MNEELSPVEWLENEILSVVQIDDNIKFFKLFQEAKIKEVLATQDAYIQGKLSVIRNNK